MYCVPPGLRRSRLLGDSEQLCSDGFLLGTASGASVFKVFVGAVLREEQLGLWMVSRQEPNRSKGDAGLTPLLFVWNKLMSNLAFNMESL